MSDPKVEERARKLLKPHVFRVGQRRADLGGIRVESSAVDYWEAVHVVADLLAKLDEAEKERIEWVDKELIPAVAREFDRAQSAEERERALIAGVRGALEAFEHAEPCWDFERFLSLAEHVRRNLSHLLSSTPTEEGKNDE